ncbi:MAG: hypothetical protein II779_07925, partial [Clostridia bacterium]|nr:hypothetical protein [Clostridia bacterium]
GTCGGLSDGETGLFHKKYWQKKELFHVKHFPKSRVFLRLRKDRQSDPQSRNRDNAECAPESLPQGRRIYPAHVSAS